MTTKPEAGTEPGEKNVWQDGKYIGFEAGGKLYLTRCPKCDRENYAMAVSSGQCAWCGWKREEEKRSAAVVVVITTATR